MQFAVSRSDQVGHVLIAAIECSAIAVAGFAFRITRGTAVGLHRVLVACCGVGCEKNAKTRQEKTRQDKTTAFR